MKNCKFGNLCKNPKCVYIHPNLPQKSQLKWVAPALVIGGAQTNLNQSNERMSEENAILDSQA